MVAVAPPFIEFAATIDDTSLSLNARNRLFHPGRAIGQIAGIEPRDEILVAGKNHDQHRLPASDMSMRLSAIRIAPSALISGSSPISWINSRTKTTSNAASATTSPR